MDIRKQVANIQKSASLDPRFKKYNDDIEITDNALSGVNKLFNSILPHFPAWRQTCPCDDDLSRLKLVWTKALLRNKQKTGVSLNLKAGITACEESDTDWLPSVGKFIKMCEQSNDLMDFAKRALDLFIRREKQIDSVGRMVTAKHAFDLRKMKAADCEKGFIAYYLDYAKDNAIEPLESHLLTETVQLSPEQQKEADKRKQAAQNEFMSKFSVLIADKPKPMAVKPVKTGLKSGKIQANRKSTAQLEKEKQRQLSMIKELTHGK